MNLPTANKQPATCRAMLPCQAGVGLVEVLIAVLVLSIGILGVAALQTQGLGNSGNAMGRSMATIMTYSILEGMRIDRTSALAGDYNTTVATNNCPSDSTTLVSHQLHTWCDSLGGALGQASTTTGTINCTTAGYCTVTIHWYDSRGKADAGGQTQTLNTVAKL